VRFRLCSSVDPVAHKAECNQQQQQQRSGVKIRIDERGHSKSKRTGKAATTTAPMLQLHLEHFNHSFVLSLQESQERSSKA
jgi:hypothetical protein